MLGCENHGQGVGGQRDAGGLGAQALGVGHLEVEVLDDGRQQDEGEAVDELLPDAGPLAGAEGDEVLRLADPAVFDEALRPELQGLRPQLAAPVQLVVVEDDAGAFGDEVACNGGKG